MDENESAILIGANCIIQNVSLKNDLEEVVYYEISIIMWMNAALPSNIYSFIYCAPIDTCLAFQPRSSISNLFVNIIGLSLHYFHDYNFKYIPGEKNTF